MKVIPIITVFVLIIAVAVTVFYLESTSAGRDVSGGWSSSDSAGSMAGQFGTEIEVVYTDGSTSQLKILGFTFGGEEVAHINFKLSTRVNGTEYSNCSVDLTGFYVSVELRDSTGLNIWDFAVEYGNVSTVPLDSEWYYVYEITVTASDFDLDPDVYTLGFNPSGSIYVQGLPGGVRYESELPSGRSMSFNTELVDPVDPINPDTRWINVDFSSGVN